jgi:hypothetical protein
MSNSQKSNIQALMYGNDLNEQDNSAKRSQARKARGLGRESKK